MPCPIARPSVCLFIHLHPSSTIAALRTRLEATTHASLKLMAAKFKVIIVMLILAVILSSFLRAPGQALPRARHRRMIDRTPARRVGCGLAASLSIAGGFNNASIATLAASAVFRRYAPRAFQGAAGGKLHKASVAKHAPREPPPVLIARACLTCHNFPAMLTVTTTAMCGHGALRVGTLHGFGRRQPVTARVDDAAAPPVTPPSMPMCS
mmetsp:Transcript_60549/g.88672  ORF Transcript_60549/g.88672 Transcript_60549/m.88672 type:complete len:210 (-) Transcript_60549:611-1240(-)